LDKLKDFTKSLGKAYKAFKIYPEGHEIPLIFLRELWEKIRELFRWKPEISFIVDERRFLDPAGNVIYDEKASEDNIAWIFYRGGLRGVSISPGVTSDEVKEFLEAISKKALIEKDPYAFIALLGQKNLENFQFELAEEYIKSQDFSVPDTIEDILEHKDVEPSGEPIDEESDEIMEQEEMPIILQAKEVVEITKDEGDYMSKEIEEEQGEDKLTKAVNYLLYCLNFEKDAEWYKKILRGIEEYLYLALSKGDIDKSLKIVKLLQMFEKNYVASDITKSSYIEEIYKSLGEKENIDYILNPDNKVKPEFVTEYISMLHPDAVSIIVPKIANLKNNQLKNAAAVGISQISGLKASHIEKYLKLEANAKNKPLITSGLSILAKTKFKDLIPRVIAYKDSPDSEIRRVVLETLVDIGSTQSYNAAMSFFDDEDENVRLIAYQLFKKYNPSKLKKVLKDKLLSKELDDLSFVEKEILFNSAVFLDDAEITELLKNIITRKRSIFRIILGDEKYHETEKLLAITAGNLNTSNTFDILLACVSYGNKKIRGLCQELLSNKKRGKNAKT